MYFSNNILHFSKGCNSTLSLNFLRKNKQPHTWPLLIELYLCISVHLYLFKDVHSLNIKKNSEFV